MAFGLGSSSGLGRSLALFLAMKALATFLTAGLLLLGFATTSQAAWPPVEATFGVERSVPFSLRLDGQPVARFATQAVHLDQLAPGQHWVEMSFPNARGGPRVRAAVWLEAGLATTFVLSERPGYGWQLRQVSTAALDGFGYEGQGQTYSLPTAATPGPGAYPSPSGPVPPVVSPTPAPAYPAPTYPAPAMPLVPMSPAESAELVQALRSYAFDDRRLPLAQQALAHSYLQAAQLASIVRTMTFSESQKRLAVLGYAHLSDPQNFHRVLNALTFPTDANSVLAELGLPY